MAARADTLQLQSHIHEDGAWVLYQQGPLSKIRPLQSLVDGLPADVPVQDGLVLYCGTLGAIARADGTGIRPAARMRVALVDGARRIGHDYRVSALPLVS